MAIVKRGNCEYQIDDSHVNEYLERGFSLLNDNGEIIQRNKPTTLAEYKAYAEMLSAQVKELEKECAALKIENSALSTSAERKSTDSDETSEKPKAKK